jgi:hypothetical protein
MDILNRLNRHLALTAPLVRSPITAVGPCQPLEKVRLLRGMVLDHLY